MLRLTLALLLLAVVLAWPSDAAADAQLCTLGPRVERELLQGPVAIGAAVIELDSGVVWSGGADVPYAMHSMIKPPVAWAVLTEVESGGEPLTTEEQRQLRRMITVSRNEDVEALLKIAGGLRGLADYYERWGVPEMVDWMHPTRWGFNQRFADLARGPLRRAGDVGGGAGVGAGCGL